MKKQRALLRSVTLGALLAIVLAVSGSPVEAAKPDPTNGYGPNDRPVFLVISLDDTFVVPSVTKVTGQLKNTASEDGSQLVIVEIGTYIAGADIGDTRYEGQDLANLDLSALPVPIADLDGHAATILGSFCTFAETIHLVTPDPDPIDPAVQAAFFNASVHLQDLLAVSPFPTTCELTYFVYDHQDDAGASFDAIGDALFRTNIQVDYDAVSFTAAAEGDLFPHEPDEALFSFEFAIDAQDGSITADVCLPIDMDIKPGSSTNPLNLGSEGVLPVAILSDAFFDAPGEVDVDTLTILGASIDKWHVEDVNDDGLDDLMLHWRTQDLVDGGADEYTTQLEVRGRTFLGMCIEGADTIRIVPPSK